MRMGCTVVNVCVADKENTVRVTNREELLIIAAAAHIVLLYDDKTPLSRVKKAQGAFIGAGALSFKAVDEDFKTQVLFTIKDFKL